MGFLSIVKPGAALEPVFYFASYGGDAADEFFAFVVIGDDGHEVGDLPYPFGGKETREQYVGIREIELFGLHLFENGADGEAAAFPVIEEGGEDAGGVELREAHEIDGSVESDEGRCVEVAYNAIIFNGLITQFFAFPMKHANVVPGTGSGGVHRRSAGGMFF